MRFRAKVRKSVLRWSTEAAMRGLRSLPRTRHPLKTNTILIIRFATLGESILALPMVRALRESFPGSHIAVLTKCRELWETVSDIDEVIDYNSINIGRLLASKYRHFDLGIDTEPGNNASAILARLLAKVAIGFATVNRGPMFDLSIPFNDQQYEAQTFLDLLRPIGIALSFKELVPPVTTRKGPCLKEARVMPVDKVNIGINVGASEGARVRLWPLERFGELIRLLDSRFRCRFVFFGLTNEQQLVRQLLPTLGSADVLDLTDKLSIDELIRCVGRMDLMISTDTGTMHLASALKVPVFSFFGPNLPLRFAPRNPGSTYFYHKTAWSPCINVHLPTAGYDFKCPCNGDCVKAITVEEVFSSISAFMERTRRADVCA